MNFGRAAATLPLNHLNNERFQERNAFYRRSDFYISVHGGSEETKRTVSHPVSKCGETKNT